MKSFGAILGKNGVEWWAEGEFIGESDGINIRLSIGVLKLSCTYAGYFGIDGSKQFPFLRINPDVDTFTLDDVEKIGPLMKQYNLLANYHQLGRFKIKEVMGYDRWGECNPVSAEFIQSKKFREIFEEFEKVEELDEVVFLFDASRRCVEIHFVRGK